MKQLVKKIFYNNNQFLKTKQNPMDIIWIFLPR